jgi:hydrogenase maturation protease
MILGVGNKLLTDEGFGIHIVEKLVAEYEFGANVSVVDGGVLGINLLGTMSEADELLVVDVVRNNGEPGTRYRIDHEDIPDRVRAKNSLHQIDFLEALTLCQALDHVPHTTIIGVEPVDIETHSVELTPTVAEQLEPITEYLLKELDRLGGHWRRKGAGEHVPCNSLPDC